MKQQMHQALAHELHERLTHYLTAAAHLTANGMQEAGGTCDPPVEVAFIVEPHLVQEDQQRQLKLADAGTYLRWIKGIPVDRVVQWAMYRFAEDREDLPFQIMLVSLACIAYKRPDIEALLRGYYEHQRKLADRLVQIRYMRETGLVALWKEQEKGAPDTIELTIEDIDAISHFVDTMGREHIANLEDFI